MKNKKLVTKQYKKLIDKIFFQTLGLFIVSLTIILFARSAVQGKAGDIIAMFFANFFNVDYITANQMYFNYVQKYITPILIVGAVLLFAIFYKIFLSWFTKYFDEMITAITGLANREQKIIMSPELSFIEDTINQIKTELERSAEVERELEKRKNDLIVYLAHDIKTPLTSVIGYLSLLDESPEMPIEQKCKYVHITLEKAYRLEKLINEFFEITRYNLHSVPLHKEEIDLCYMMVQIVDEAYPQLSANKKEVLVSIPDDLCIYADSEKMARVFNNILKNAIAYSSANSIIEISAEKNETTVKIHFKNKGEIPQDKLKSIFDKFSRLDQARQSSTGGAGLGLAIAKDIIMLHSGTIYANSCEGKTTITIQLPNIN